MLHSLEGVTLEGLVQPSHLLAFMAILFIGFSLVVIRYMWKAGTRTNKGK